MLPGYDLEVNDDVVSFVCCQVLLEEELRKNRDLKEQISRLKVCSADGDGNSSLVVVVVVV